MRRKLSIFVVTLPESCQITGLMKTFFNTISTYTVTCCSLLLALFSYGTARAQQSVPALNQLVPAYRMPYHQWRWQVYKTPAAHIYYPAGMDSVCAFTLAHYIQEKAIVERKTGMTVKGIPSLVIYPAVSQAYESRIGSWDAGTQAFPTIARQGNRIILGFNGSYKDFTEQLRVAFVRNMWQQSFGYINGTDLRSTASEQDWQWFKEGCIQYMAEGFSLADNDVLFQWYRRQAFPVWSTVMETAPEQQLIAVKGFCYFLEQAYRKDAVKQILFQLRKKKTFAVAVRLVCKRSFTQLQDLYMAFLYSRYGQAQQSNDTFITPILSCADSLLEHQARLVWANADTSSAIWLRSNAENRSVWMQQAGQQPKKLYTYALPSWISNHHWDVYPLVCVSARRIYIIAPDNGIIQVSEYTSSGTKLKRSALPRGIDGISSFEAVSEREWLMTAYTKGRSDVIRFLPGSLKVIPVTNDLADNTLLTADNSTGTIRYYSGYPDLIKAKKNSRIKDSIVADTIKGKAYGWYSNAMEGKAEQLLISDSTVFEQQLQAALSATDTAVPQHQKAWLLAYQKQKRTEDSIAALEAKYKSQGGSSFLQQVLGSNNDTGIQKDYTIYDPKQVQAYKLQLHSLWFQAAINNDYFINRLQPYQGYLGTYKYPEIGGMFSSGYSDIFEQHQFSIGYKLPAGTEGSDFFVRYHNKQKRLDWYALYFRKAESLKPDPRQAWVDAQGIPYPAAAKVKTYYYELGFNYPFTYHSAVSATIAYRKGRTVFLATDPYSLPYPALREQWNMNTLALNHHHLKSTVQNNAFYSGFRNKLLLDVMMQIGSKNPAFTYGISNQFEWHQPLDRAINWVTMLKAGYSGGGEHILYTFGGVDHNVNGKVDSSVLFNQQDPYVFQSLVTQLRGFKQNSLYGNVYGLLNTDVYVQIFDGLFDYKTPYSFINRLQLGAFADVAWAWETWKPDARWQQRHSFGLSAKTILAGYPIRLDLAFPYNFSQQPMLHFSLRL
ncbi:hypothetical protein D3C71_52960 [compost metagenome]